MPLHKSCVLLASSARVVIGHSRLGHFQQCHLLESCHEQLRCFGSATHLCQLHTRKARQSTPHWYETELHPWKKEEQLVDDLIRDVLYQDENIVAINKPSGIPMHALKITENLQPDVAPPSECDFSIAGVLPALRERLESQELREVFSQHRLYSGVTLLTKSKDAHDMLQKYFRHVRANKLSHQTYWALTVGIPQPEVSEEEIALSRAVIHDWHLSVQVKNPSRQKRKSGEVIVSSVKYRLLNTFKSSQCHMALVELQPVTVKWDAIQLFLLRKLAPAFGDHKYSSRLKTVLDKPVLVKPENCFPAPQILPYELSQRLQLNEKDSGLVPLHVHCHQLVIPDTRKRGGTITITAPLPNFYERTLRALGLRHQTV